MGVAVRQPVTNTSGVGVLASLKEPLVDAAESRQPRDLSDHHVLVLAGLDGVEQLGELLAAGVRTEVSRPSSKIPRLIDALRQYLQDSHSH